MGIDIDLTFFDSILSTLAYLVDTFHDSNLWKNPLTAKRVRW